LIARKAREQHDNIKKKAETWKETSVFNKTLGSVICMSLFWSRTPSNLVVCCWKIEQQHFRTVSTPSILVCYTGHLAVGVSEEAIEILFKTVKNVLNMFKTEKNTPDKKHVLYERYCQV